VFDRLAGQSARPFWSILIQKRFNYALLGFPVEQVCAHRLLPVVISSLCRKSRRETRMSTEIRALPVFGKRSTDEAWANSRQQRRELAVCPWRFCACIVLLVGTAFLLLLEAVGLMGSGGARLVGGPGAGIVWASGAPGLLAGVLVLIPAAFLAQCAFATFSLAVDAQPLVTVDTSGITVLSRSGEAEMAWEEVGAMRFTVGGVRLDRRPRAVPRLCTRRAFEKSRVRVPAFMVNGGSNALKQAIAEVRPDIARRFCS
jgi:hypothetical protein